MTSTHEGPWHRRTVGVHGLFPELNSLMARFLVTLSLGPVQSLNRRREAHPRSLVRVLAPVGGVAGGGLGTASGASGLPDISLPDESWR